MEETQNGNTTYQDANNIINIKGGSNITINLRNKNDPFNVTLAKEVISAIRPYSDKANECLTNDLASEGWNKKTKTLGLAQEAIMNSYGNMIGGKLRSVFAIGVEEYSGDQLKRYIISCIDVAKTCLQLLCFTLISDLWNKEKENPNYFNLTPEESSKLLAFFEYSGKLEYDLGQYLELFQMVYQIYRHQPPAKLPIAELENFDEKLKPDSDFYKACVQLSIIQTTDIGEQYTDKNSTLSELSLTIILVSLNFLAAYKMISIKSVSYNDVRNTEPHYLHKYVTLGQNTMVTPETKGVNYIKAAVNTDSILLYRNNYLDDSINLFPFIIDYNALMSAANENADSVNICIYSAVGTVEKKDEDGEVIGTNDTMRFSSDDNNYKTIVNTGMLKPGRKINFSSVFQNDAAWIKFKCDNVCEQFLDAKKTLVGA